MELDDTEDIIKGIDYNIKMKSENIRDINDIHKDIRDIDENVKILISNSSSSKISAEANDLYFSMYGIKPNINIRHDIKLINVYTMLGDRFGDRYSEFSITFIEKKYIDYYSIKYYSNDSEYIKIYYDKYKLDKIMEFINNSDVDYKIKEHIKNINDAE